MFQEYPKWVNVPDHEHGGKVVYSKEEEDELQKEQTPSEEVKRKPGRPKKGE